MSILWFRRDLRVEDNPALCAAMAEGVTRAVYIATPGQWQIHHMAPIQADFIERHLNLLSQQLLTLGIILDFLVAEDYDAQRGLLIDYCHNHQTNRIFANAELEVNEIKRDQMLINSSLELNLFEADVVVPKGAITNQQGSMFKVFTPFKRAWLNYAVANDISPISNIMAATQPDYDPEITPITLPYSKKDSSFWPLHTDFCQRELANFFANHVEIYQQQRDFPGINGTSKCSPYLAIGAISVRSIVQRLLATAPNLLDSPNHPAFSWLNELIWRDFYRHLLYHFPKLSRHQNFRSQYNRLYWINDGQMFSAWCEGRTGYPIVDAAMRQLVETGWMHNRLRMIVASFLTKHLLIDWRWGEQFFIEHLIDGDLAANNGGWQWSAGTGCDAQPYFRIFNPISQSQKFDPQGDFIRQYLPQLRAVPNKNIHFPHSYLAQVANNDYWPAIVDHKTARLNALAFYRNYS